MIQVCIAGAMGWVGRPLVRAVTSGDGLALKSAMSRSAAGRGLDEAPGVPVFSKVTEALEGFDVLIDYTSHDAVRDHAISALEQSVNVVIGTSGLTRTDYDDIDALARRQGVGVVAAGNFSLTAALAEAAALLVAPFMPQAEVIDYASSTKGGSERNRQRARRTPGGEAAPDHGSFPRGHSRAHRGPRRNRRRTSGPFLAPAQLQRFH
jgi:4-hydroxy-tetrahydrodipicolinate reductase